MSIYGKILPEKGGSYQRLHDDSWEHSPSRSAMIREIPPR